jgi:DNA-binding response OmpR family regulator
MASAAAARTASHPRKTVLVVDDDGDARHLLTSVLESAEYDVLQAGDGAEALRVLAARGARCNIILLDLMMPVMNGWDFRRKQRESAELAGIPVLLMSAGAHIAVVSGDLDAAGFMAKPVEVADLLAQVKKHCA